MKYKHIEAAREVRLWIAQIIVPAVGIAMMMPETRKNIGEGFKKVKNFITRKKNKIK